MEAARIRSVDRELYNDATAPGLSSQPAFVQFGEGVRIKPVIGDRLELNYAGSFQQFVAPSSPGITLSDGWWT